MLSCDSGGHCGNFGAVTKEREEEKVCQFLMGLNDAVYGAFQSGIIQQESIPLIIHILARILKEEQYRHVATPGADHSSNGTVFAAPKASDYSSKLCSQCNKVGHDVASCFQLIGYPDWWKKSTIASGGSGSNGGIERGGGTGRSNHDRGRGH